MKFEDMINTIQLGDCYELIKDIPDNSIDCVYIDVPYLYQKGGSNSTLLGQRMAKMRKELKNISNDFDMSIFDELLRVMKFINIFIWCSKSQILNIMKYFEEKNVNFELLTWNKTNPVPKNNSWNSDIEYCLTFREKNHLLNSGYELKSKWYVSPINQSDKVLYNHPTIKPLELVKRHLLHATQENDIVLDCFCGSGTTCVASKELNRRFIGMEINKEYHKISVNRLNGILANGQMSIFTDTTKL